MVTIFQMKKTRLKETRVTLEVMHSEVNLSQTNAVQSKLPHMPTIIKFTEMEIYFN